MAAPMGNLGSKPAAFASFSETKRSILNDIRSRWATFSEDDLGKLRSNDDLINEIAARYGVDRAQAQSDVEFVMQGRQI
jgi:hypothetical protein